MKPYSMKRFIELLDKNYIRLTWYGEYIDITERPSCFFIERIQPPEVLNALYDIYYPKSHIQELYEKGEL